jgi:hypothetical protein
MKPEASLSPTDSLAVVHLKLRYADIILSSTIMKFTIAAITTTTIVTVSLILLD